MKSHNDLSRQREQNYQTKVLKKVNHIEKDILFASLQKEKGKKSISGAISKPSD
jgi:hypothetical protein